MSGKVTSTSGILRLFLGIIIVLVMVSGWSLAALADTLPQDVQYGSPTSSGEAAVAAAEGPAKPSPASPETSAGVTGFLPATGGPLLALVALATLALASTGLLAVRQIKRTGNRE